MTAGATAITIFHKPTDARRFDEWLPNLGATARAADGFIGSRVSVHNNALDWAVELIFTTVDLLDEWLDSPSRKAPLREGEALGFWRQTTDIVLAERELPPAGVAVFMHSVAPGREAEFVAAQAGLTVHSSGFPGYEGTAVFPDSSGQWMSVLRFRTAHQLMAWLRSSERQEALPDLRAHLTRNFSELPRSAPFGSTVRTADGQTRITPAWKTAMVVVLCLYPTVMVLSKSLAPTLNRLGLKECLTVFASNVTSVALLTWILVPAVSRPFRRWLDPVDGAAARISMSGAAVIVLCYAALVAIFAVL